MADQAPDPARSYERAKPEAESGMGRLDNNQGTPTTSPDKLDQAVSHKQKPHQINAEEDHSHEAGPLPPQPNHSMHEEEPLGWDQAPTDIHNPREKRHPRKEGKGGTP